ncbi:MAG: aspartate kinase [Bacteroidetes bacterium]|nr:MAG: aspartate kinase [Bacteroidota bacterium]
MQIFKFGGASIRSAEAIRNMTDIVSKYGEEPLLVVVSAMGKTTRHLEDYIDGVVEKNSERNSLEEISEFHFSIMQELFQEKDPVFEEVGDLFAKVEQIEWQGENYSKFYDSVVSVGEMVSSTIIAAYLNKKNIVTTKINAPDLIKCRGRFQAGKVSWPQTEELIKTVVIPLLEDKIAVTQGFIGSNSNDEVITLGKEGSDYTAAIFASCLNAESVTIWKDVPGILSADPKLIDDTTQILHLPYTEASEMTYYGASVIHPKTIKPLANKSIPLYVRSFDEPGLTPTEIYGTEQGDLEPTIILKKNQCLFTFRVRDYTFVDERSLASIFTTMHELDISINILQSSAITISVCFDFKQAHVDALFERLQDRFSLQYLTDLELLTLKNYNEDFVQRYGPKKEVILEQRSRRNCRFLLKPEIEK